MPRSLFVALFLTTAACAPAPQLLAPRVKSIRVPKTPHVTASLGVLPRYRDPMPVTVPDTRRLEPMPVVRPDSTIDRDMAVRGYGTVATIRLRGPAKVAPTTPPEQAQP